MQYFGFDRPSFGIKMFGFGANPDDAILALFAGGKQGVWYDPSDKSTLFQDAAGVHSVTADGDPVGLRLDKSKGLVLGSNLATSDKWVAAHPEGVSFTADAINFNNPPLHLIQTLNLI